MPAFEDAKKRAQETLEATWWIFDREPNMDNLMALVGDSLDKMFTDLNVQPFQDKDKNDRLFLARFEFPKYGASFHYADAIFIEDTVAGFIDFLAGFPVDCCEMLLAIGQYCTKADQVITKRSTNVVAPVPQHFFTWPDIDKVLFNLTALPVKNLAKIMAKNLEGEDSPKKAHWWFRVNLSEKVGSKFPVPGEFLCLGVRMMPDKPWGRQKTSPFLYAGNWMDTVYLTSAVITEVIDPTNETPYSTYQVKWRGETYTARPSDFSEYKVDDRVTILKDISVDKSTQLWKDDDMKTWGDDLWQIVPITFYGLEKE